MIELSSNIHNYLEKHFGKEFASQYKDYVETDFKNYLRISGNEDERNFIKSALEKLGIIIEPIPSIQNAYLVKDGNDKISKTLEYTLGKYYIQSLSSMIPPLVISPSENEIVLDMCAAPGSKSTQISELMNNKGTLYSNEPNFQRIKSLVFNLDKTIVLNMGVLQFPGEVLSKYYDNFFDKILVDAPCSGLGIVQKKGEVSNWWSDKQVLKLVESQWKLLVSAIKSTKVGGEIIYSTCTMTLEENELLLHRILEKYPVELEEIDLPVKSHPAFTTYLNEKLNSDLSKAKRIIPWEINSEGFFIAKLRKISATEFTGFRQIKNRGIELLKSEDKKVAGLITDISKKFGIPIDVLNEFKFIIKNNDIFFIDKNWFTNDANLFTRIGTHFGSIDKYGNCILHSLAARMFEKSITENIIKLKSEEEFQTYMSGGVIKSIHDTGQKVVKFRKHLLGTAAASKDGLKSQFPRAMRMQRIIV